MYVGTREMEIQDVTEPGITPGEVVLKVGASSICGSDLHGFLGKSAKRVPPLVMGHEFTGEVVEIGAGVDDLDIGDRVTVNPILSCGRCPACLQGRMNICPNRKVVGIDRPGAFASFVSAPSHACIKLPDHLDDLTGSMVESLSNAVHIFDRSLKGMLGNVAIIGAGTQGLLALQVALLAGAQQTIITDMVPSRLEMARFYGASHPVNVTGIDGVEAVMDITGGAGVDLVVEAVGHVSTQSQTVDMLKVGGEAVLLGLGAESSIPLDGLAMVNKELTVRGTYAYNPQDFAKSLELISAGKIDVTSMVVSRNLVDGSEVFETLVDRPGDLIKVALIP